MDRERGAAGSWRAAGTGAAAHAEAPASSARAAAGAHPRQPRVGRAGGGPRGSSPPHAAMRLECTLPGQQDAKVVDMSRGREGMATVDLLEYV